MASLMFPREFSVLSDSLVSVIKKDIARQEEDSVYVELGVRRARTSWGIAEVLSDNPAKFTPTFLGVDCDINARGYWQDRFRRNLKGVNTRFFLGTTQEAITAISHAVWVFIDACHCFECATWDIENWGDKILPGGNLVIHDTTQSREHYDALFQHNHTRKFGVSQAVNKSKYLKSGWKKISEVKSGNGIVVYEKL